MGFPSPSLNVVFNYFSHSCPKMCKICLKRTLDATFLDCLALTFCDVMGQLLPEWVCLTLQGRTTFLLTSKLADIPVSRVRKGDLDSCITLTGSVHLATSIATFYIIWTRHLILVWHWNRNYSVRLIGHLRRHLTNKWATECSEHMRLIYCRTKQRRHNLKC